MGLPLSIPGRMLGSFSVLSSMIAFTVSDNVFLRFLSELETNSVYQYIYWSVTGGSTK